jgi:hypothetical protein
MLDSMIDAGKIKVSGSVMTMLAGDNPEFQLLAAYRFVRTIDNGPDPASLVSQIRSEAELKKMGAEIYMDSVIYQDVAYQADPGFIAEKRVPGQQQPEAPASTQAEPPAAAAAEEPPADKAGDGNDLSKFILDNLL